MSYAVVNEAVDACRAFVNAIVWGEHVTVWELLGPEGRKTVLRIALERGMDDVAVGRIRDDTASEHDRAEFLTDLVNGLRADLSGTDVDVIEYELDPEPPGPGQARVVLMAPLAAVLGGGIPAGYVELQERDGRWVVERLIPRLAE